MCRGTVDDLRPLGGRRRLEVRAFYLRLSSSSTSAPPAELALVYRPAIGGAALELGGRALPPACPAEVTLLRVRGADGKDDALAYASADRVSAAEGARFEVYAGKELAAEGAFARRNGGWRVECCRPVASHSRVAEVLVLAEGGVLVRARARASAARRIGCTTRLEGIPEEEASSWGPCECGDEWEMVGDSDDEFKEHEEKVEAETMRWALEMGAWAVCVGVGLLATARRFSRRRAAQGRTHVELAGVTGHRVEFAFTLYIAQMLGLDTVNYGAGHRAPGAASSRT